MLPSATFRSLGLLGRQACWLGHGPLAGLSTSAAASSVAAQRVSGSVPEGHRGSDLSSVACNIGLGRRRDLTLRQDLGLFLDGQRKTLAEVFKGQKVILVGFPGGPVCTEKHIPQYIEAADVLRSKGVHKTLCVTIDEPEKVQAFAKQQKLDGKPVQFLADSNGSFMRLLGLELAVSEAKGGPRCQRFAAIVEDGILLKLRVEESPGQLKVSDAQSMLQLWKDAYNVQ